MRLNSVILLNLCLVLSSCSVSKETNVEKSLFYGPSSQSIDGFTKEFYRLPTSLSEVADWVVWREDNLVQLDKMGKRLSRSWKRCASQLRNNEKCFSFWGDSCLFHQETGKYIEHHSEYSPLYLLSELPYLWSIEHSDPRLVWKWYPGFYDRDGNPDYRPDGYGFLQQVTDLSARYSSVVCRIVNGDPWPYKTILQITRDQPLQFVLLKIHETEMLQVRSRQPSEEESISEAGLASICSCYISELTTLANEYFSKWTDLDKIIFVSGLYVNGTKH